MKVRNVDFSNSVNFARKPNQKEMQVYTKSINEGLKLLNKKVDIIIHNSAAPSSKQSDIGIGTLFSDTSQRQLMPFLKAHGITGIQQEPNNLRHASPYMPEASSKNIYMIPLDKLTTDQYNHILPIEILQEIVSRKRTKYVDYDQVKKDFDYALRIAYSNFKKEDFLKTEFEEFKSQNTDYIKNSIFKLLCYKYQKPWQEWEGIDKNLYAPKSANQVKMAQKRIEELKNEYKDEIDFYMFQQFLIDIENQKSNKLTQRLGVTIIGDSPVAQPAADEWADQDLYLKGMAIGCPPDYFSAKGQRWGFKYFNPTYIFNKDGSLGKAGRLLKQKYDSYFASFPGGLRIDHIIGLIDPFIYTVKSKIMTNSNSGRIYSQFSGKYQKSKSQFANILRDIVLKSAEEHGMAKDKLICEDLGDKTKPTKAVMKELDLSGITLTQFGDRGANASENSVIMIGSHDNPSLIEYTDKLFSDKQQRQTFLRKTSLLAKDIAPQDASKEHISTIKSEIRTDKKKFMLANFIELFTSPAKRIQIFFTDFFGIGETYNTPGTSSGNWILRIDNDFENKYYNSVAEGTAPNLATIVLSALRQRGLDKTNPKLVKDLETSAKILSEV